jgi:cytoskeleton-associated protein 5
MSLCSVSYQKATKWSERRDAVAELTKLASTKKIAPGDFNEVSRTLKKVNIGLKSVVSYIKI